MRARIFLWMIMSCFLSMQVIAQKNKPVRIAVFAPVYLDSAFKGNNYIAGNNNLPRNILPGLDYYNGVMMAVDSLNAEGIEDTLYFFDTKNSAEPVSQILARPELEGLSLIIASFNNRNEIKAIADFAQAKQIPLISETYPNDGGLSANPYFVMINSTLKTHCDGLYRHLQQAYPTDPILYLRRKGSTEDLIQLFFTEMGKRTPALPLKMKTAELSDSFDVKDLLVNLDSNRLNVIVCGSLNESFGTAVIKAMSANKNYRCVVIGMPTWDSFKDLGKPELKGVELVISSPYYFSRTDKTGMSLTNKYRNKFLARPSDMVFKGFESMYHFTKLAIKYPQELANHLSDRSFRLFNDFDIQPVRFKRDSPSPDYLENKKLYFIKRLDGMIKSVNQ